MASLHSHLMPAFTPFSAIGTSDGPASDWISSSACPDGFNVGWTLPSAHSDEPVSVSTSPSTYLSPSLTNELLEKLNWQLDKLIAAAPAGQGVGISCDGVAGTPLREATIHGVAGVICDGVAGPLPSASSTYDEAKALLAAQGATPCPSAKENEELFKLRSRGFPAPAPGAKTKPTEPTEPTEEKSMLDTMFNGICGRVKPGNCRLGYTGGVAIRTSDGTYKTYNLKTGQLTNCDRFVFDAGDDLFMMVPTRKLRKGDIVLFGGKPKCVIENLPGGHVKVINYDTAVIEEVVPERHVFMGRRFYGKIVSLMGNGFLKGGKGGMFRNLLKFKLMSSVLGTGDGAGLGGLGNALPMMFMLGGGSLDGMFDFDGDEEDDGDEDGSDGEEGFLGALLKDEEDKPDKTDKPDKGE